MTTSSASNTDASSLVVEAPAKINLYLGVSTECDERGYHRVDSIMSCVDLADVIRIVQTPGVALDVSMLPQIELNPMSNTAYVAAYKFFELIKKPAEVSIVVEKHIPMKSGMGGPSADAAGVLLGLCRLYEVDPHSPEIVSIAQSVGADVPFFLYAGTCYMNGAGDVFAHRYPQLPELSMVVLKPRESGVTAVDAYRRFDELRPEAGSLECMHIALESQDINGVYASLSNNLADVAIDLLPECGRALDWLLEQEEVVAGQVTGSGACVFGFVESRYQAENLAAAAREAGPWWSCVTHLRSGGPRMYDVGSHLDLC